MNKWDLLSALPGTKISVPTHIFYNHVGIVSDLRSYDGYPLIISNSPRAGGVVEETFAEFSEGKPWRLHGFPGGFQPEQVLFRARTCQRRKYDVLTWNCDNFVNYCHGIAAPSGQLIATLAFLAFGAVLLSAKSA